MKTIDDARSIVQRNHAAREYHYKCRRRQTAKWDRIARNCLAVSLLFMAVVLLVGWSL